MEPCVENIASTEPLLVQTARRVLAEKKCQVIDDATGSVVPMQVGLNFGMILLDTQSAKIVVGVYDECTTFNKHQMKFIIEQRGCAALIHKLWTLEI